MMDDSSELDTGSRLDRRRVYRSISLAAMILGYLVQVIAMAGILTIGSKPVFFEGGLTGLVVATIATYFVGQG
jgi:hypothetical protein